ncbi:unnamed protein product [Ceratitis capitata]|uniref:(Mediterranean fruit fly) hypothetical protein n=1 Tax=Ceratitis capitata TaxID=7213 RepID=A0A811UML2_CERCA|nr:unnamed protein product [Ceratitis capitata]
MPAACEHVLWLMRRREHIFWKHTISALFGFAPNNLDLAPSTLCLMPTLRVDEVKNEENNKNKLQHPQR